MAFSGITDGIHPAEWAAFPVGVSHAAFNFGKGLFGGDGGSSGPGIDIPGELNRISELIAMMKARAEASINKQAGQGRAQSASNLAARGVYSSPVSQHTFNHIEDSRINAIADANASLDGQEAGLRQGVLNNLLGLRVQQDNMKRQADAARFGALTSLGGNVLISALSGNPAPAARSVGRMALQSNGGVNDLNYEPISLADYFKSLNSNYIKQ